MKKSTIFTAILLIVLVFSFVAFSMLSSMHFHRCAGEDCPICHLLNDTERLIEGAILILSFFATLNTDIAITVSIDRIVIPQSDSLVLQRVKITS